MTAHALLHDRLGPFRVEHLLGEGAMSEVYAAIDERLDRPVALKVLHRHLARSADVRKRFATESRLAARLNHPHIVPIYEADEIDGLLYISMYRVDGSDLSQLLVSKGPLSPTRTAKIISQAASALDAAHDTGLIHRDVKPANMLVSRSERGTDHVFLSDFGLTKVIGSASRHTQTGQIVGTVHYMSPEQIAGRDVTHLSDVYSLGCVLYECLTGATPFERDSDLAVLWAHVNADVPAIAESPKVPRSLDDVIQSALAKGSEDRYQSAGELARAVRTALRRRHLPTPRRQATAGSYVRRVSQSDFKQETPLSRLGNALRTVLFTAVVLASLGSTAVGLARVTGIWSPAQQDGVGERSRLGDVAAGRSEDASSSTASGRDRQQTLRTRASSVDADASEEPPATQRSRAGATGFHPPRTQAIPNAVPGPISRTASRQYNAAAIDGYGDECVGSNLGCVEFTAGPKERFVWIRVDDSSGGVVRAWVKRDLDADGSVDGEWAPLCGELNEPLRIVPGALVRVVLQRGKCGSLDSTPTTGRVTAVFSTGKPS